MVSVSFPLTWIRDTVYFSTLHFNIFMYLTIYFMHALCMAKGLPYFYIKGINTFKYFFSTMIVIVIYYDEQGKYYCVCVTDTFSCAGGCTSDNYPCSQ